jgi:putative transcriptional regulator
MPPWLVIAIASTLIPPACLSQMPLTPRDLGPGVFLVARRSLPDPNFRDAVILMIQYDRNGAMGLVINRATGVLVSELLEDMPHARKRKDHVYLGGPVGTDSVLALSRSSDGDGARPLPDVVLIASKSALEKKLAQDSTSGTLRIFAGYSGWGPRQLDRELSLDTWHLFRADAATVFLKDAAQIYPRLIRMTELKVARGYLGIRTLSTTLRDPFSIR